MRLFLAVFFVLQLSLSSVYFGQAVTIFDGTKKECWTNLTSRTDEGGKISTKNSVRGAVSPRYKLLKTDGSGNTYFEINASDDIFFKPIELTASSHNSIISQTDTLNVTIEFMNLQLSADTSLVEFKFSDDNSLILKKMDGDDIIYLKDKFIFYPMGIIQKGSKFRIEIKYQNNAFPDVKLFAGNNEPIETFIGIANNSNKILYDCVYVQNGKKANIPTINLKNRFNKINDMVTIPSFISSGSNVLSVTKFEIKKLGSNISPQNKSYPTVNVHRFGNERYLALLIGSNKYNEQGALGLKDLRGVEEDYNKIKQKLIDLKYELTELKPVNLDSKEIQYGHTKSEVLAKIREFEKKLIDIKEPTKVVVYFAGHGFMKSNDIQCFALDNDKENQAGWDLLNQNDFLNIARNCSEFIFVSDACRQNIRGVPINIAVQNSNTSGTREKPKNSIQTNKAVLLLAAPNNGTTTDESSLTLTHFISAFLDKEISLSDLKKEISPQRILRIQLFNDKPNNEQLDWGDFYFSKFSTK